MIFQSVCEKKLSFGGCKVLVSDVKNWWGGKKFGCVAVRPISWACYLPGKVPKRFPPPRDSTAAEQGEFHLGLTEEPQSSGFECLPRATQLPSQKRSLWTQ